MRAIVRRGEARAMLNGNKAEGWRKLMLEARFSVTGRSGIAGAAMTGEPQGATAGWNSPAGKLRAAGGTTGSR